MRAICHTLLLLVLATCCGCTKKGEPVREIYGITGLSDVTVRRFSDTTFTAVYQVAYPAGLFELVTFNIDDVPPGVTVSPRTASDTTSFSVQVTYHVLMTVAARYRVGITLFSGSQGKKEFSFYLNVIEAPAFGYALSLPQDITLPLYTDTILRVPVAATYTSGIQELINITVADLPANISASPSTISGTPTFTDTMALHVTANEVNSYRVVMHGTSSQGIQSAGFNINVATGDNCAQPLADTFSGNTICAGYTGFGTGTATIHSSVYGTNKLLIHLPFADAVTELNCSTATLNMLPGPAGGLAFASGTGSFTANTMVLSYALAGAINTTCTTTLTR